MAPDRSISNLQALVRIPTISLSVDPESESAPEWSPFETFIDTLAALYPATHAALSRERIAGHSLLYRWVGRTPADPVVLMAHYDVVPATDEGWQHPPFDAHIEGDGEERVIWGRGTLDDKGALAAIMEAVEQLTSSGFVPARDVYLSFGHNEETQGAGARAIADVLGGRGIRPGLVLDEGGAIVEGVFPGVAAPMAVVGVSEKGITSVSLTVQQEGGHASTPPRMTATVRLARAITRLNSTPFPARLSPTNIEMLRTIGPHSSGLMRFAFTNLWLTKGLVTRLLGSLSDETRAITRTTQAVTRLSGSAASNVLAENAVATVNMRVAVGSSVAEATEHIRRAIADDHVAVTVDEASEPSPVSPTTGEAWSAISAAITAVYPGTIVTPYIMLGASDSRHFTRISDSVYRFTPFRMSTAERATLHAIDERMHVATWLRGIEFYATLIRSV